MTPEDQVQNCKFCANEYLGADGVPRCRVHHNGLQCSPAAAFGCKRFVPYEITVNLCDCMGRGD